MWSKKDQDGLTERSGQRAFPFKGQCCKSNITKASWLGVKKNDWVNPNKRLNAFYLGSPNIEKHCLIKCSSKTVSTNTIKNSTCVHEYLYNLNVTVGLAHGGGLKRAWQFEEGCRNPSMKFPPEPSDVQGFYFIVFIHIFHQ